MQKFLEYAQSAGLSDILEGKTPGNFTVFVPSPEALKGNNADDTGPVRRHCHIWQYGRGSTYQGSKTFNFLVSLLYLC